MNDVSMLLCLRYIPQTLCKENTDFPRIPKSRTTNRKPPARRGAYFPKRALLRIRAVSTISYIHTRDMLQLRGDASSIHVDEKRGVHATRVRIPKSAQNTSDERHRMSFFPPPPLPLMYTIHSSDYLP